MNAAEKNASPPKPEVILGLLKQLIAESKQLIAKGEEANLELIEESVAAFCQGITSLPNEEARPFRVALQGLMEDLTQLGTLLQSRQRDLLGQMQGATLMKKANVAYQTSDSMGQTGMVKKRPPGASSDEEH